MEKVFIDLQKRIADGITEIEGRVDEDFGQLEDQEGNYPIVYPCILMTAPEISWRNLCGNNAQVQMGSMQLIVSLCIDCYHDTHYNSTTSERIAERQALSTRISKLLQGYMPLGCHTPLVRTYSRSYTKEGGIKVYEQTYTAELIEELTALEQGAAPQLGD